MLFFAKKLPNAQARGRRCVCGCAMELDGSGGVQAAGVWRLFMDQVDLMDLMDKMGAPRDNPGVCMPLSGLAWVEMCRWVARAVWQQRCAVCGGVTLVSDLSDLSDLSDKLGRHDIPCGFACRCVVWLGR